MDDISVVYKIGGNKKWGEYECLRYSIRSVVKNFKDLKNIVIVGEKPSWISDKVIHILAEDISKKNKDASIIHKLLVACDNPDVSDSFVNISDDQLILIPITSPFLKAYTIDSDIRRIKKGKGITKYGRRVISTLATLEREGLPNHLYEGHVPYLLNKQKYKEILEKYDFTKGSGMVSNTLYFNNILDNGEQPVENVRGFIKRSLTMGQIITECRGKLFLGYQRRGLNKNLKEYLRNTFKEKSIYEK